METPNTTNQTKTTTGFNPASFTAKINEKVKAICARDDAWATEQATELFLFMFSEYIATLDDLSEYDGDKHLEVYIRRFVNMNGVNNRLKAAEQITDKPKTKTVTVEGLL